MRQKADCTISGRPRQARIALRAVTTDGTIVAGNASDSQALGTDKLWNGDALDTLKSVVGGDFEVVAMGDVTAGWRIPGVFIPSGCACRCGTPKVMG